ncbi:MAG: 7-carboxy-7-deazaguanine synthase [Saprospiraceae bacterium]|jgi:7-carboxy-7-deazaguanine synthase (Cx14CxxC type)|nr:7-carboxy-7-deazaguanine synthase [Saprospiraceae bacterium]MBL0025662.1 7-carboxy-7-deazaguanine synthase [Saprospiraceae bacterium]
MYKVKEVYYTLQGEGFHTGRPAVFCRFSGCNLWTGREVDRENAICKFCDTNFWGTDGQNGGKYTAGKLSSKIQELWPSKSINPFIVCTGGEPALQMNKHLIDEFHKSGFEIAIETNGTVGLPEGIDWICVSPKADTNIVIRSGDELKLVYPQPENNPTNFINMDFKHFYLQPLDNENHFSNIKSTIEYCLKNPLWKLSSQTHKYLGID